MKASSPIQLIAARWIIPIDKKDSVLEDHCLAIEDGKIQAVLPRATAEKKYPNAPSTQLNEHVLLPGLINSHSHAAMSLFRGVADDIPLKPWLENHIWPLEGQFINPEFVELGTRLSIAEMIQSGTTCFNDMYFFPDVVAHTAESIGIRATVGLIMLDFPTIWASGPEEYLSKGLKLADELKFSSLVTPCFAPHAPYTVSDEPLSKIRVLAEELDLAIHMHLHETQDEVDQGEKLTGMRPLARLNQLGLLSPRMLAVHMVHLTDDEIELIAQKGVNLIHCPRANLKLASGIAPIKQCLDAKVNIALGTDGVASNNDVNLFGEMRFAASLAKGASQQAQTLTAWQALKMATINAAKALNIDSVCGSLEKGKSADFIAVDLSDLNCQPVYNPVSQLVYSVSRNQVTHSWVEGKLLMENRRLTGINTEQLLEQVRNTGDNINSYLKQAKS